MALSVLRIMLIDFSLKYLKSDNVKWTNKSVSLIYLNKVDAWCYSKGDLSLYVIAKSCRVFDRKMLFKPGWSTSWAAADNKRIE